MFNILRFTCKESFTFRGSAMAARPRGCADGASERRTVLPLLPRGTDQHVQDASTLRAPRTWTTVGCAKSPTSIDAQWASPGIASRDRVQNVLVIAALRDSTQRRMLEDRMVEALGAAGTVPPPSPSPLTLATPGCRRPGSPATGYHRRRCDVQGSSQPATSVKDGIRCSAKLIQTPITPAEITVVYGRPESPSPTSRPTVASERLSRNGPAQTVRYKYTLMGINRRDSRNLPPGG